MFSVMGHCLCFSCLRPNKVNESDSEQILRIVKMDGKVLEYKTSHLVKDLLVRFEGCGVAVTQKSTQYLPPDYELNLGHYYYLLPLYNLGPVDGVKRIKVVISKQQLQELLSKKVSVEDVLLGSMQTSANFGSQHSTSSWRPVLETIAEGNERRRGRRIYESFHLPGTQILSTRIDPPLILSTNTIV